MNLQIRPARRLGRGRRATSSPCASCRTRTADVLRAGRPSASTATAGDRQQADREAPRAYGVDLPHAREAGIGRRSLYLAWDFTVASERNLTERALHIRDDAFALLGDTDLADGQIQGDAPDFTVTERHRRSTTMTRRRQRIEGTFQVPCYLDSAGLRARAAASSTRASARTSRCARTPPTSARRRSTATSRPRRAREPRAERPVRPRPARLGQAGFTELDINTMAERHNAMYCATDWTGMNDAEHPVRGRSPEEPLAVPEVRRPPAAGTRRPALPGQADAASERPRLRRRSSSRAASRSSTTRSSCYDSNSQGGIMGGALTALAPDFQNAVLGVPAINYSVLLRRSVDFDAYATIAYDQYPNERSGRCGSASSRCSGTAARGTATPSTWSATRCRDPGPQRADARRGRRPPGHDDPGRRDGADDRCDACASRRSTTAVRSRTNPLFDIPAIGGFPFTGDAASCTSTPGPVRVGERRHGRHRSRRRSQRSRTAPARTRTGARARTRTRKTRRSSSC